MTISDPSLNRMPDVEADVELPVIDPKQPMPVNEIFGPTLQGEGPMIGCPCIFIRTHGCPVQCPDCDTHYTWDGSERALKTSSRNAARRTHGLLAEHPGCGVVLSGGEPLLHQKHAGLRGLIESILSLPRWVSIETSGVAPGRGVDYDFLRSLSSVTLSPKITPCLPGQLDSKRLYAPIPAFMEQLGPEKLCFKFVVRDIEDLKVVIKADHEDYGITQAGYSVYLMPYGILREEVMRSCVTLIPMLSQTGYTLSPRLHALLWGKQRGV